jgi:hypothetical protein
LNESALYEPVRFLGRRRHAHFVGAKRSFYR